MQREGLFQTFFQAASCTGIEALQIANDLFEFGFRVGVAFHLIVGSVGWREVNFHVPSLVRSTTLNLSRRKCLVNRTEQIFRAIGIKLSLLISRFARV